MVRVNKLMAMVSEAPTTSMPSVSRRMVANSSHSRMVVAIQMPRVQARMLWPNRKAPGLPRSRDMK